MKKLVFILAMGALFSFLPGCDLDDDGYSLNDAWVGFGLVNKATDSETFTILMDDGEVLYPLANSGWSHEVENNERVLTNFTILGNKDNPEHNEEYYVKINSLRKILYKGILDITPEIEDSIGNDPIRVKDKWIKNDMLNFELQYWGGNEIHYINLVKQPGVIDPENGPVVLELRHNTNDDTDRIPLSAIVTFDLSALQVEGKTSTQFKVIAKGFDGNDFEYTGEYKY
ncbi:MAG TPA: NigD-like C-terminal domain-containing protein [Prolixibacteraceae bacterium]|nr:NigD-like C-terminal domain-containing protein [Prolixibacteraceae bacterium]